MPGDACATRDAQFQGTTVKARYTLTPALLLITTKLQSVRPAFDLILSVFPFPCRDVHAAYLAALNFAFAKVVSTDEVLKTVSA